MIEGLLFGICPLDEISALFFVVLSPPAAPPSEGRWRSYRAPILWTAKACQSVLLWS